MSLNKCLEKCANLDLNKKKREGGGLAWRAQRLPPKQIENSLVYCIFWFGSRLVDDDAGLLHKYIDRSIDR